VKKDVHWVVSRVVLKVASKVDCWAAMTAGNLVVSWADKWAFHSAESRAVESAVPRAAYSAVDWAVSKVV
jgi:hypothetical protein